MAAVGSCGNRSAPDEGDLPAVGRAANHPGPPLPSQALAVEATPQEREPSAWPLQLAWQSLKRASFRKLLVSEDDSDGSASSTRSNGSLRKAASALMIALILMSLIISANHESSLSQWALSSSSAPPSLAPRAFTWPPSTHLAPLSSSPPSALPRLPSLAPHRPPFCSWLSGRTNLQTQVPATWCAGVKTPRECEASYVTSWQAASYKKCVFHSSSCRMSNVDSCPLPPGPPEPPAIPPQRAELLYTLPVSHDGCTAPFMRPEERPHPNCTATASPRFALVLHGMVSKRSGKTVSWDTDADYPASHFVDPTPVYAHFVKFVMEPSGGAANFDTFVHTATPSEAVRARLRDLYRPLFANFTSHYHTAWKPRIDRIIADNDGVVSEPTASRWLSAQTALLLVKVAEEENGRPYDKIYLTRPDVLIWVPVDLRRYCNDLVYYSNCYPPFFPDREEGCPSDFHYVMSSAIGRMMATMPSHLQRYRNAHNDMLNRAMGDFVTDVIGAGFQTDHVVIARHEELLRKTPNLMMEANYYKCYP